MKHEPCILFVEDDDNDVVLMRRACEVAGLACLLNAVEDSRSAIDYLQGNGTYQDRETHPKPSLILLDLKLLGSSGFDVLEWLRGRPEREGLPVIVFSSSWVDADVERARELGADEYIVKPNGFQELVAVCKTLEAWIRRGIDHRPSAP